MIIAKDLEVIMKIIHNFIILLFMKRELYTWVTTRIYNLYELFLLFEAIKWGLTTQNPHI